MFEKMDECCRIAFNAFDGEYGWISEIIALVLLVLIFNFIVKVVLKRLHKYLSTHHNIWFDSLIRALYKPLSVYIWFFALLRLLDMAYDRIFAKKLLPDVNFISVAAAILAVVWFIFRWKHYVIQHMAVKSRNGEIVLDRGKIDVIDKLITVLIIFIASLVLLELFGLSLNTLIAFGGVGGLAIAFSSQEIIASFFGGMMIYLTHPFVVGDWIVLPEKGIEGHVEEIGWYMTKIRALDKRPVYVPNAIFSKIVVVNPSRMSHRPFKEVIGIRYSDQPVLKKIISELRDLFEHHPDIDHSMTLVVRFFAFGNYTLDIQIIAYTKEVSSVAYYRVREDLLMKILEIVHSNGADLAFPTTTLETSSGLKICVEK